MSLQVLTSHITTAGLPERERFDFWREAVGSPIGFDLQPSSHKPFYGELVRTRVKGIVFSQLRCAGHRCTSTHLSIRRAGREAVVTTISLSKLLVDGVELRPGEISFLDTTRPYAATIEPYEYEALLVEVPREIWLRRVGPTEQIASHVVHRNTYIGELAFNFFCQLIPNIGTAQPAMASRLVEMSLNMLNTMVAYSFSQEERHTSGRLLLLSRARTLIEENLDDPSLNQEKVARALRISTRYLQSLFQESGMTMCDWMWNLRLEKCRQRLSDPLLAAQSITEIAFNCGFSDLSHFGRKFKAAFSISPSEFRRQEVSSCQEPSML